MIVGLGSDICNSGRIEKAYARFGERFLRRCFGENELAELKALADNKPRFNGSLAKRFAAKEAFAKALGTGFADGIAWAEIEVVHLPGGRPELKISGQAAKTLDRLAPDPRLRRLWVSLSDDRPFAQAVVIIESITAGPEAADAVFQTATEGE